MKAKLVLISAEADAKEFKLALPTKIGRGQEAKLKLVHPLVSRVHCEIFEQGEQLMVRDMASLNGTFVDDQRVGDEMVLPSGCRLTVGSANFHVLYGADYDRPLPVRGAAKSGELTKIADDTVPISPAKAKSASKEQEESSTPADADSHESEAHEDTRTIDFDFLSDSRSPKTEPAPPAKAAAPARTAAKPAAAAKPVATAKPAASKPAAPARPPNPAEFADEEEALNSAKPFAATGRPPAKTAPAAPAPAAPAADGDEMVVGPVEQSSDEGGDPDLDDFLKSIM